MKYFRSLLSNEKGQGLTEYLTLLILISLVAVASAKTMGKTIRKKIHIATKHISKDINFKNVNSSKDDSGKDDDDDQDDAE